MTATQGDDDLPPMFTLSMKKRMAVSSASAAGVGDWGIYRWGLEGVEAGTMRRIRPLSVDR